MPKQKHCCQILPAVETAQVSVSVTGTPQLRLAFEELYFILKINGKVKAMLYDCQNFSLVMQIYQLYFWVC